MHNSKDNSENNYHNNHTPTHYEHTSVKNDHISTDIKASIKNCLKEQMAYSKIISLAKKYHEITISLHTIIIFRDETIYDTVNEVTKISCGFSYG